MKTSHHFFAIDGVSGRLRELGIVFTSFAGVCSQVAPKWRFFFPFDPDCRTKSVGSITFRWEFMYALSKRMRGIG
jgi:hypothetical protein